MRDARPERERERSECGGGRGEEMEERQKVEEIKREQMGHEGVVNALAPRTGLCTCMRRERIFFSRWGLRLDASFWIRRSAGTRGGWEK